MSPPHEDAVGSFGEQAITWIEESQKITLRWWQRLAITRQLEHREDGTLCHRTILESAPRRAGKSVRLRGLALWRMAVGPELFGEIQTVVHSGSDVAICREIQRASWRWAEEVAGWSVSRANGKEAVETPYGDRWLVRAQSAVYGYDVTLGLGDECWNVSPDTISEGLEPAMLERSSPQLHLTSTAHRRATSLMRGRLSAALASDDGETLLMVWGALPDSDPSDPDVWRAASPHWTEDRRKMIASKYNAALSGQADPEADDLDPMAGFLAQYLNIWRLSSRAEPKGEQVVTEDAWTALSAPAPKRVPDSVAVESWFSEGVSVARAWRIDGGQALVSVTACPDLSTAAASITASGYRGKVTVGASLAEDPALTGIRVLPSKVRTTAAVGELSRLLSDDALRHDGGDHLNGQVLDARTQAGIDGPRLVSRSRADAVKAATWSVEAARKRTLGRQRVLLPSTS